MFCNEISWHDMLVRQVSGNFADCAVRFANWLANLPIGKIGRLNGTYTLYTYMICILVCYTSNIQYIGDMISCNT